MLPTARIGFAVGFSVVEHQPVQTGDQLFQRAKMEKQHSD
jgi:hypothetical protein